LATTAERIPSPEYVEFNAGLSSGLDLMGLRLPVQTISNRLLNGLTTVTPLLRYLSLRTWLIHRYAHAEPAPPDSWSAFTAYAQQAEAAFALANLLRSDRVNGIVGSRRGTQIRDENPDGPFHLKPLTRQPAIDIYGEVSDQLRITQTRIDARNVLPKIGEEHGEPLVRATEASLGSTAIARRLLNVDPVLEEVTLVELEEFASVVHAQEIPEAERLALLEAVLPSEPQPDDLPRLSTYTALLALADGPDNETEGGLVERDLFMEALAARRSTPALLHDVLEGWLLYCVRDCIAVTGELGLQLILDTIRSMDPDGLGVRDIDLVRYLIESTAGEQLSALRELGLGEPRDDLESLPFRTLVARVEQATEFQGTPADGIRRWTGGLTELEVAEAAPGFGGGALVAGIASWLLSERRVGLFVREGRDAFELLSREGSSRLGIEQVILPRIEEWVGRDLSLAEVLEEYTHILIDQHLRIVWARLALDPKKDVSVFLRDGDRLLVRSDYSAGRTASRVDQAINWLGQLGLLASGFITAEGRRVLERCFVTLENAATS